MKIKGVNFFEQHVEKIVLGVVGVLGLGALGFQMFVAESTVAVGKDRVPPAKAMEPVKKAAETLRQQVVTTTPAFPKDDPKTVAVAFAPDAVRPSQKLPKLGPVIAIGKGTESVQTDVLYAAFALPEPSLPAAHSFRNTIAPQEWKTNEALRKYLPAAQPFDKAGVSVEVAFDGASLKAALAADPDGEGPAKPIPTSWWRDAIVVMGVELERERLDTSGNWVEATTVGAIPGRPDLLGEIGRAPSPAPGDLQMLVDRARAEADQVMRPDYYRLIAGEPWVEPSKADEAGAGPTDVTSVVKKLAQANAEAERIRNLMNAPAAAPQGPRRDGSPPGGKGTGGGGGKGGAPGEPRRDNAPVAEDPARKRLQARLDQALARVAAIQHQLNEMGFDETGQPLPAGQKRDLAGPAKPLLDDNAARLWAHDISATPGKVYRYRVRIVTNNPFYGQEKLLKAEQQAFAQKPVAHSPWSEWTEPVAVDSFDNMFVTSARVRDAVSDTGATFEVYKFYYGYDRKVSIPAQPGDQIAGEVKIPKELLIYDLDKLDTPLPPGPGGPAGERPNDPRLPRGPKGPAGPKEGPPPSGPATPPGTPAVELPGTPVPPTLAFSFNQILLDVASVALGASADRLTANVQTEYQVVIRDEDGRIITRRPTKDSGSDLYKRINRSAEQGEKQTKPIVKPEDLRPRPLPTPDVPRPREGPGGAGGGGGG